MKIGAAPRTDGNKVRAVNQRVPHPRPDPEDPARMEHPVRPLRLEVNGHLAMAATKKTCYSDQLPDEIVSVIV
jgi:hypothetical protein